MVSYCFTILFLGAQGKEMRTPLAYTIEVYAPYPWRPFVLRTRLWMKTSLGGGLVANNRLFYGDNLEVMRRHIADESVDLVYLDPPFNSNRSYNVLFGRHVVTGASDSAQIQAFGDTWVWTPVTD